jgi:hypothetical protein
MNDLKSRRELIIFIERPAPVPPVPPVPPVRRHDIRPAAAVFAFGFTLVAVAAVLWAPLPRAQLMVSLVAAVAGLMTAMTAWFRSRPHG